MKKALIIVQSKNSTTQKFGESIAEFLGYRGLAYELIPINNFEPKYLNGADYLLLSGWKNESLFSVKRPDNEWEEFVNKLPSLNGIKTALFAANKFFSGGMLKKMKKYLGKKTENLDYTFKSRDGYLTVSDKLVLNEFIK
jgi:flavodoxin